MRTFILAPLLCAALLWARELSAQSNASAFVPADHWSVRVVDRLQALGLAPRGTVRGQRSRTVGEVRTILEAASDSGPAAVHGYLRRFAAEFATDSGTVLTHASGAAGIGIRRGDVAHGVYSTFGEENWTGVRPRADKTTPAGAAALLFRLGQHFAGGGVASGGPALARAEELYLTASAKNVGAWAGRRVLAFGPGTSGIVLGAGVPLDGAGLYLPRALYIPVLGAIRFDIAAGKLPRNGAIEHPYFVVTRGSIEPHPRLGFGVTRAGMIGNIGADRVGVGDILFFLMGGSTDGSEGDNQVVSADAWYRPPTGALPMLLYLEWGAEDSAGAWLDVPGIVAGIELPAVLPSVSLVLEHSVFNHSRAGNPAWYRHIGFLEGWSTRGELLGHPLGGNGREWQLQARSSWLDGALQMTTAGFVRQRGAENLFAPERSGRSVGITVDADGELHRGVALRIGAALEDGDGWRRTQLITALRFYLPQIDESHSSN